VNIRKIVLQDNRQTLKLKANALLQVLIDDIELVEHTDRALSVLIVNLIAFKLHLIELGLELFCIFIDVVENETLVKIF
jgi:hypothetical protein